jgi:eukaryotic-like serine/threonine-protein kinase
MIDTTEAGLAPHGSGEREVERRGGHDGLEATPDRTRSMAGVGMHRRDLHGIILRSKLPSRPGSVAAPRSGVRGTTSSPGGPPMTAAADRHLLFGLLALQNGLINQVQLVAAFQAWTLEKSKSLADHLEARGDLTSAKRGLLDALAAVHVEAHGGDIEKSLAAVPANRSTRAGLAELGKPEIEATLARVARRKDGPATEPLDDDPDRTASIGVGSATSDGQRFRILRPHAKGDLGAVFVALDGELHREVALKQMLEKHADDPVSRQRFVAEAEITGGLEHPGVVPVYGLGTDAEGRPYYAMRFIRGDSLKEAIDQFHQPTNGQARAPQSPSPQRGEGLGVRGQSGGRSRVTEAEIGAATAPAGSRDLALRKLLRRFTDVCTAIDYAHSRGAIHRDLKPANIVVGKYGETLVVDWGLAKAIDRADPSASEQTIIQSPVLPSGTRPVQRAFPLTGCRLFP